eukprot:7637718-Alexandrium_andersonii.AAC.1
MPTATPFPATRSRRPPPGSTATPRASSTRARSRAQCSRGLCRAGALPRLQAVPNVEDRTQ